MKTCLLILLSLYQEEKNKKSKNLIKIYDILKKKVKVIEEALKKADLKIIGETFNDHWSLKRQLSEKITNSQEHSRCGVPYKK